MTARILNSTAMFALLAVTVSAQETRVKEIVAPEGAKSVVVNWEMSAAQVSVKAEKMVDIASADIFYTPEDFRYTFSYETRSEVGYLDIDCETRSKHRSVRHDYDGDNEWDVIFSTEYPMELSLEVGACDAHFDLTGLPLRKIELKCGAVSGGIEFATKNPERLKDFLIEMGASSLELRSIGNANFDNLTIDCGASSLDLDLRGEYTGESTVDIDVGMGSADIILPRGVAARIEADDDNWFSSVDIDRSMVNKAGRGVWETDDYDTAKNRIILILNVGMGNVDIRWR